MKHLFRITETGNRISGNGSFPALKENDIGRDVVITRYCLTWEGCLGYFADDPEKKTHAFWLDELIENNRKD